METREERKNKELCSKYPLYEVKRKRAHHAPHPLAENERIAQIQNAVNITAKAFQRVLRFIETGREGVRDRSRDHA